MYIESISGSNLRQRLLAGDASGPGHWTLHHRAIAFNFNRREIWRQQSNDGKRECHATVWAGRRQLTPFIERIITGQAALLRSNAWLGDWLRTGPFIDKSRRQTRTRRSGSQHAANNFERHHLPL